MTTSLVYKINTSIVDIGKITSIEPWHLA